MVSTCIKEKFWLIAELNRTANQSGEGIYTASEAMDEWMRELEAQAAGVRTPTVACREALASLSNTELDELHRLVMFGRDCSTEDVESPAQWMREYVHHIGLRSSLESYLEGKPMKEYLERAVKLIERFDAQCSYSNPHEDEVDDID